MPLTLRSNGVAGGLISSAWWNDYYNLLTGVMTDQPVTIHNQITLTGGYGLICNGQLGKSSAGDVLDAAGTSTYLKASTGGVIALQIPNGTTCMQFKFDTIECNNWLGIRTIAGTKLGEFKGNGNLLIAGGTFQSVGGTPSLAGGGSFDTFDVAEVFPCDQVYTRGTVVCPGPNDQMVQCTHDNCYCAMVVSATPGVGLGVPDPALNQNYVAISGRVNVLTAVDMAYRTLVVSDGRGGVRPAVSGELAFTLGFTLNSTAVVDGHPQIGLMLRPMFVKLA